MTKNIWLTLSEPRHISGIMVLVYFSLLVVGSVTIFGAVADPPSKFYEYNLDVFWMLSGFFMILAAPLGVYGAWLGEWDFERPAVIGAMSGITIQSLTTLTSISYLGLNHPLFMTSIVTGLALFVTRWLRISKEYKDPTPQRERVQKQRVEYEKTLEKYRKE